MSRCSSKRTNGNSFLEDVRRLTPYDTLRIYWIHVAQSIDRVTLHKDLCSEVPSSQTSTDYWQGGWYDYPDKERALAAMEQAGPTDLRRCPLCKP